MAKSWVRKVGRVGRKVAKVAGRALKKRYVKKGNLNLGQISKDVLLLKNMVNAEKKMIDNTIYNSYVGQVDANATGSLAFDMTPVIPQSNSYAGRSGRSLKFSGCQIRLQISQMASTHDGMLLKMFIIRPKDAMAPSVALTSFLDVDKLTNVIDYNSCRNPDHMQDFHIVATRDLRLRPDNYSGGPQVVKDYQINLKLNHHLRYDKDTTTVTEGQLYCIVVANTGNRSTTTASTVANVAHTAINTGVYFVMASRFFYYDN